MSESIPTDIDVAITGVRNAQLDFDEATGNLQRVIGEHIDADERVNSAGSALREARDKLYEIIVEKPRSEIAPTDISNTTRSGSVRVVGGWEDKRVDGSPSEGVDVAWSDKSE